MNTKFLNMISAIFATLVLYTAVEHELNLCIIFACVATINELYIWSKSLGVNNEQ